LKNIGEDWKHLKFANIVDGGSLIELKASMDFVEKERRLALAIYGQLQVIKIVVENILGLRIYLGFIGIYLWIV